MLGMVLQLHVLLVHLLLLGSQVLSKHRVVIRMHMLQSAITLLQLLSLLLHQYLLLVLD